MSTGSANTIAGSQYIKAINRPPYPGSKISLNRSKYGAKKVKKEKKMGWFRKKFMEWSRRAWEDHRQLDEVCDAAVSVERTVNAKTSVRFTVYPASGGFVIEHYKQDRYKDSDGPELTIVNHGDELGKAVEHILTMEALRS